MRMKYFATVALIVLPTLAFGAGAGGAGGGAVGAGGGYGGLGNGGASAGAGVMAGAVATARPARSMATGGERHGRR